MPDGLHLVVAPCVLGCKELEKRCEHRVEDAFLLPASYDLQISRPMTLQCKIIVTSNETIAHDGRLEYRN